ncbi:serine hydrolase [Paenibacillus apiarius]|uniref:Serine hydrolase n=1 Tax=Paenibacillus apiarius TaxID=46240 RepID=A0ABT4DRG6_9BACL|nr:serine hydrolase [Paenibacillus apiarius]MCY9514636.1 serine hydrolase [Paenibacillus apiarius]MCY9518626.1 serine hydrolase [Paenibacillus apiarius]MCY9552714.1 serine hydrolase [Paenibacillus apiarius]MCY9556958.1 serine hydrolase [Paenibacillus apiarius]MCY9686089.1 serine hydrolase [Paenibacillus apiarius]
MEKSVYLERMSGITARIEEAMREFEVPGLAVAVVHKQDVLFRSGFGLRDVARQLPVNTETVFGIGSSTKSFTAMVLAMLVQEGGLEWDAPVKQYWPDFRMHDAVATELLTFRDIACHRSGMPNHQFLFYKPVLTDRELLDQLRYLEPSLPFRQEWQYSNVMFFIAGCLIGSITGTPWEQWVESKIFAPLGMKNSNFSVAHTTAGDNFSLPYDITKAGVAEIPFTEDRAGAAGDINACVSDLAAWVSMQLNQGESQGHRLLSEELMQEMQRPQTVIGPGHLLHFPEMPYSAYGLGWIIDIYRGHKLVHHGGKNNGFTAHVSFMPADEIGIVILANRDSSYLPDCLAYTLYDQLLAKEPIDWMGRFKQEEAKLRKMIDDMNDPSEPAEPKPSYDPRFPFDDYTGHYYHPAYGGITIHRLEQELSMEYRTIMSGLIPLDQTKFRTEDGAMDVTFARNEEGGIQSLQLPLEPTVSEIVFVKQQNERDDA